MHRQEPEADNRPERQQGRSRWIFQVIAAVLIVLVNMRRAAVPWWTIPLIVVATAVLIWRLGGVRFNELKNFASLEELSEAITGAKGARRYNLVWYEYAIARNVHRGTYNGERPLDFKMDVYELSARLGMGTKFSRRVMVWTCGLIAIASIGLILLMMRPVGSELLVVIAVIFFFVFGLTWLVMWLRSRTAMSKLGRRVEEVSLLPTADRWKGLLAIARDELGTPSPA